MSRSSFLILLGVLTMLAPVSGLPSSWVHITEVLFGLCVAIIGFSIRVQKVRDAKEQEKPGSIASDVSTPLPPHGVSPI